MKRPWRAAAIGGAFVVGLAALAGWGQSTGAFWTDSVAVTGTSFTTGTWALPAPSYASPPCSGAGGKSVKFTWNAVSGAVSYVVTITPDGGTAQTFTIPSGTTYTYTSGNAQEPGTFTVQAVNGSGVKGTTSTPLTYKTANGSGASWSCV